MRRLRGPVILVAGLALAGGVYALPEPEPEWRNEPAGALEWVRVAGTDAASFHLSAEQRDPESAPAERIGALTGPCLDLRDARAAKWSFTHELQGSQATSLEAQIAPDCGPSYAPAFAVRASAPSADRSVDVDLAPFLGRRIGLRFIARTDASSSAHVSIDAVAIAVDRPRACAADTDCDDGRFCTGRDVCQAGACTAIGGVRCSAELVCSESAAACLTPAAPALPLDDFEEGAGAWRAREGSSWTRAQGGAPGPEVDHTLGAREGAFLYTESSTPADLEGPCLDLRAVRAAQWRFFYRADVAAGAVLEARVAPGCGADADTLFTAAESESQDFTPVQLDLTPYAGGFARLVFRGARGVAIDDVSAEAQLSPGARLAAPPIELNDETVEEDQVFPPDSVYIVSGTLRVAQNARLEIEGNVELRFNANARLVVEGELTIPAEKSAPVVLTSNQAAPTPGFWNGVSVSGRSGHATIDYAYIHFADVGIDVGPTASAEVIDSQVTEFRLAGIRLQATGGPRRPSKIERTWVENKTARRGTGIDIRQNVVVAIEGSQAISGTQRGIATQSSAVISRNTLENNGVGIEVMDPGAPVLTENVLRGNGTGLGYIAQNEPAAGRVSRNSFEGNTVNLELEARALPAQSEFFDVRDNWWGTTDPFAISASIIDSVDPRNVLAPTAEFIPFLDSAGGERVPENPVVLLGTLRASRVLPAGARVDVLGRVLVPDGLSLSFEAGANVLVQPNSYVRSRGALLVRGSEAARVVFTSAKMPKARGDWAGLRIEGPGSELAFARIEFTSIALAISALDARVSRSEIVNFGDTGVVLSNGTRARLDLNRIMNTGARVATGVLIDGASPTLSGNRIEGMSTGIEIQGGTSEPRIIEANTITANSLGVKITGTGATGGNPRPVLEGNNLFDNRAGLRQPARNIAFEKIFGPDVLGAFNLRGNYWNLQTAQEILASIGIVAPGTTGGAIEFPTPVDISGFTTGVLPGGQPAPGSQNVVSTRVAGIGAEPAFFSPIQGPTQIRFNTFVAANVRVEIRREIDAQTNETPIAILLDEMRQAGRQSVAWDGRDQSGALVPEGAYVYRIALTGPGISEVVNPAPNPMPLESTGIFPREYDPELNEHARFVLTLGAAAGGARRITLIAEPGTARTTAFGDAAARACVAAGRCFTLLDGVPYPVGSSDFYWDGRGPDGAILQGDTWIEIVTERALQPNFVVVRDLAPKITGTVAAPRIEVQPAPYRIVQSHGQLTLIDYQLDQDALVTVSLIPPSGMPVRTLQRDVLMEARNADGSPRVHRAELPGLTSPAPGNVPVLLEEGTYTVRIEAVNPMLPDLRSQQRAAVTILQ